MIVAAFEGWNDAGDAASSAIDFLADAWDAEPFASIDPEEFYDFTATRPHAVIGDDDHRRIDWPANEFAVARPPGAPDIVLLRGVEPQLKWRTYCEQIIGTAETLGARLVLTLGSLLADVPHTRPTSVFGTAYDPLVIEALHLEPSTYEGPTGIVGVLHTSCHTSSLNSASLWAAVPSYVGSAPSPKASLALVRRVCEMLHTTVDAQDLEVASIAHERQISDLVAEDDQTAAYVEHLEEQHDSERGADGTVDLVAEVERFLREQ